MRFALLGSGSEGNALVVEAGATRIMLDCGFSVSETSLRLARLQLDASQLHAIVVTHEHSDHISGVARLARKFSIPVYLTHGTLRANPAAFAGVPAVNEIDSHRSIEIGDIELHPFTVPHDAGEPVQFVFGDGSKRLGVLTDTGRSTPHIETMLSNCHALVLECNHDLDMLLGGEYPYHLKQRVAGRFGHLNNNEAAALLSALDNSRLQHIVAAHISRKNNTEARAVAALSAALGCEESWIAVATQDEGLSWRELT